MLRSELGEARADTAEVELGERPADRARRAARGADRRDRRRRARVAPAARQRVRHAAGKGYPDLLRLRSGALGGAPDAVVSRPTPARSRRCSRPAPRRESRWCRSVAARASSAGSTRSRARTRALIALDLRPAARRRASIAASLTATLGPGLAAPRPRRRSAARGIDARPLPAVVRVRDDRRVCGHPLGRPGVGGLRALRRPGRRRSRWRRPCGELRTLATPHTAAGPSLRQLALGSEGVLGAITEVTVRVRPAPHARRYEAWFAAGLRDRARARPRARAGATRSPTSPACPTRPRRGVTLALARALEGPRRALLDAYLALRGQAGGCMMICGWEGDQRLRRAPPGALAAGAAPQGAVPLGSAPGAPGSTVASRARTCVTS